MRVTLGFLRTLRWLLAIKVVTLAHRFSPRFSNLIGEVTGLNEALSSALEESDRREAGSEPPSALQAKS
jgi:hypothetical protein